MDLVFNLTLLAIIGMAAFFDIKERRIPNWIILFGVIAGLGLGGFQGSTQLLFSLLGFSVGLLFLILPFAAGWMGAGDVKFFAVVGALIGYEPLPRVFFYSCIVAGITALIALAFGKVRQMSFKNFWTDWKFILLPLLISLPDNKPGRSRVYSVPWGLAMAAGTIMAYYLDPLGHWAGF
jgi:prepilin peptidase CpaA